MSRTYLPVVLDELLPVPVPLELDELLPVPAVPLVLPALGLLMLPVPPALGLLMLPVPAVLPVEPLVLADPDELVSGVVGLEDDVAGGVVVELEDDEAGGVGGVLLVVLLLLVVPDGGATTVVLSLRSHPATPAASARAKALVNNILDFMGNSFRVMQMGNDETAAAALSSGQARKFDATVLEAWTLSPSGAPAARTVEKYSAGMKSLRLEGWHRQKSALDSVTRNSGCRGNGVCSSTPSKTRPTACEGWHAPRSDRAPTRQTLERPR